MSRREDWLATGWIAVLVALTIVAIVATVGAGPHEEDLAQAEYCDMHALWLESDGDRGWPDYRGTYAAECYEGKPRGPVSP